LTDVNCQCFNTGFDCLLCGDENVRNLQTGSSVFLSLYGDIHVDMRDSQYPPGSTFKLFVLRLCGNIRMIVPRGTRVTIRRVQLCGSRDVHVRDQEVYEFAPPSIVINVLMLCGDIKKHAVTSWTCKRHQLSNQPIPSCDITEFCILASN
jgi:hypothetical protein